MKTHRTTNHLAKGAAALLALLVGFGSMAATASAEVPATDELTVCPQWLDCGPDDDPTPPGPWAPAIDPVFEVCEIDPVTLTNPCDDGDEPGDGGDDGDEPGEEEEEVPDEDGEPEVEVEEETEENIDTPVEATPTFTG